MSTDVLIHVEEIHLKLSLHPTRSDATIFVNGRQFNTERSLFNRAEKPKGAEKHMLMRLTKLSQVNSAHAASNALHINVSPQTGLDKWVPSVIKIVKEFLGSKNKFTLILDDQRYLTPPRFDDDGKKIEDGIRETDVNIGVAYVVKKA